VARRLVENWRRTEAQLREIAAATSGHQSAQATEHADQVARACDALTDALTRMAEEGTP
jgi:hypothetical protein